ncbi:MAG: hypothetical protein RIC55_25035 [Pirellulaceae bacterium]
MMALNRNFASPASAATVEYVLRLVIYITQCMVGGAALAGLSLFYFYRRAVFPSHPGHWLLLWLAAGVLANQTLSLFEPSEYEFPAWDTTRWQLLRLSILNSAESLLLLVAGMVLIFSRSVVWGVVMLACLLVTLVNYAAWFVTIAGIPGTPFSGMWLEFPVFRILNYASTAVPALGIAVASLVDFLHRIRRDWAHWLGVGCRLVAIATFWLWQVWWQLEFAQTNL